MVQGFSHYRFNKQCFDLFTFGENKRPTVEITCPQEEPTLPISLYMTVYLVGSIQFHETVPAAKRIQHIATLLFNLEGKEGEVKLFRM